MPKICIITCYKDPDYVRAVTLRRALSADRASRVTVIKNTQRNILRYPEVVIKLALSRLKHNHDVYVLTFRGYEILPFFLLLTIGKRRIFDDLINLVEWVVYEHKKVQQSSLPAKMLYHGYRFLLARNDVVLTDTKAHAAYAAKLMRLPRALFKALPVSTDEEVFQPQKRPQKAEGFQVLYYGNMLPLHGLQIVIDAAVQVREVPEISFLFIGGKEEVRTQVEAARKMGAHIAYKERVPYLQLPAAAASSALCLAGPFGNTLQAKMVVRGTTYQFLSEGVPTLIGQTGETPELVDKLNCLLVPQGDAEALAEKILWAYRHKEKLAQIGRAGRKTYQQYYSNAVIAKTLNSLLQFPSVS